MKAARKCQRPHEAIWALDSRRAGVHVFLLWAVLVVATAWWRRLWWHNTRTYTQTDTLSYTETYINAAHSLSHKRLWRTDTRTRPPPPPARGCGEARGNVATVEAPCSAGATSNCEVGRKEGRHVLDAKPFIRSREYCLYFHSTRLDERKKESHFKKSRVRGSVFCEMWNTMQTQNCQSTANSTVWRMSGSELIASSAQIHVIKSVTVGTMISLLAYFLWL